MVSKLAKDAYNYMTQKKLKVPFNVNYYFGSDS